MKDSKMLGALSLGKHHSQKKIVPASVDNIVVGSFGIV